MEQALSLAADRRVLVVVDVQNDDCHEDGAFGRSGRDLGPIQSAVLCLPAFVESARRVAMPLVWMRTEHDRRTDSPVWLGRAVRGSETICATGSWGGFARVAPASGERVVTEHRSSALDAAVHNVRTYFGRVLTSVEIERAWAEGPAG